MKNYQFNLILVLGLFLVFALACNFKLGETSNIEVSQKEKPADKPKKKSDKEEDSKTDSDSETESPSKLGGYIYQSFDYAVYLIPKNLDKNELTKIAQDLHEREPKAILHLVDDDSEAEQFIAYNRQLEDFYKNPGAEKPKDEYPFDWANKHIVASVNLYLESGERNWYLLEGGYLSGKKISKLV